MVPTDQSPGALDGQRQAKLEALEHSIATRGRVLVAFSGGVDSSVLLAAALRSGADVLAVTMVSELQPMGEREAARVVAEQLGAQHEECAIDALADPSIKANEGDRCFHCKRRFYSTLQKIAETRGFTAVLDGSNVDDESDHRPGRRALFELGICTPMQDVGLTKDDIRHIAKALDLMSWNRPAMACLASRIPYGEVLTNDRLSRVDRAETLLRDQGFEQVRLRDHGGVARIELAPDAIGELLEPARRKVLVAALKNVGYTYVTLDLEGYRTGSMNEELEQ